VTADVGTPLAAHLREATRDAHLEAERAPFVVDLLSGRRRAEDHTAVLAELRHVDEALERCADAVAGDPVVGDVVDRRLHRLPAIEADLRAAGWTAPALAPLPATAAYVARIRSVADWPGAFVAHRYARYLGDLSGGQVIAAALRRRSGVAEAALSFYRFDGADRVAAARACRRRLDALPRADVERDAVVAEVREAYALNRRLFDALGSVAAGSATVPSPSAR
jgi:heme oxygenase (biliverdin-producing, ferredoxin)